MKQIINGLLYDSSKAEELYKAKYGQSGVFEYEGETHDLSAVFMRTKKGNYFMLSIIDGEENDITIKTKKEIRYMLEETIANALSTEREQELLEVYTRLFGAPIEA